MLMFKKFVLRSIRMVLFVFINWVAKFPSPEDGFLLSKQKRTQIYEQGTSFGDHQWF